MNEIMKKQTDTTTTVLVLNDIRSVYNTGAIFRTADAIGIHKIYLSGYTPTPIDRFGRKRSDLAKCALGAEDAIPWESFKTIAEVMAVLQKEGYEIVALEQDTQSVDYKEYMPKQKIALILGNEPNGISKDVLKQCDAIIEVPMRGTKESLNVSVATGVVLYRILDR